MKNIVKMSPNKQSIYKIPVYIHVKDRIASKRSSHPDEPDESESNRLSDQHMEEQNLSGGGQSQSSFQGEPPRGSANRRGGIGPGPPSRAESRDWHETHRQHGPVARTRHGHATTINTRRDGNTTERASSPPGGSR